jgi:hypothetical protein
MISSNLIIIQHKLEEINDFCSTGNGEEDEGRHTSLK